MTWIVLMSNEDKTLTPLGLSFQTRKKCESDIAWQVKGGKPPSKFEIYHQDDLKKLPLSGDCFTNTAWQVFLSEAGCK